MSVWTLGSRPPFDDEIQTRRIGNMKRKSVTLAPVGRLSQHEQREIAKSAIRKFQSVGYRASAAPTPERLLRAGGDAHVRIALEVVEVSRADKFEPEAVDVAQVRMTDDPFSRLCARRQLDPRPERNLALCQAGLRYRSTWRGAGFEQLRSVNLDRVSCSNANAGMFGSEHAAASFATLRKMRDAIPTDFRQVLDDVVLFDRDPLDAGRKATRYTAQTQARAVGLWVLRRGLEAVAVSLGLLEQTAAAE